MHTTTTDVAAIEPISHKEIGSLAESEYRRFADALAEIGGSDWSQPTDCSEWTVRDLAGHMVGAMRSAASVRETASQWREIKGRVRADGGNETDHMTAVQVDRTADLSTPELVAECQDLVGPATRGRVRTPAPVRKLVRFPVEVGPIAETWTVGYLIDTALTRDAFMHRIDLARAVGVDVDLDETDGRVVADIVREWAARHGRAFELDLSGPAGGRFIHHAPGEPARLEMDAVEFCRILAGRASGEGLLEQQVPF